MNDLRRPLDDEEWKALGALFDQPGGPNRDAVFGLLHAVATAPSMVPPSEWLPVAMGERELDGTLTAVMLFRHYNSVNDALAAGQPMVPTPTDEQAIRDWCAGYMLGVDIDPVWAHDTPAMEPLYPIAVLAEHDPLAGGEPVESEHWLAQAREDLGQTVVETYEALRPARQSQVMPVPRPVRRGPKIGRNAPCPCGSGKKYKKCCLRNAT